MKMKIKTIIETKVEIEAGDLLEWYSGKDHIVFVVIRVNAEFPIKGISIYDNRKIITNNVHTPHIVNFHENDNIIFIAKSKDVNSKLFNTVKLFRE